MKALAPFRLHLLSSLSLEVKAPAEPPREGYLFVRGHQALSSDSNAAPGLLGSWHQEHLCSLGANIGLSRVA
jgi:hypothetical protein